MLCEPVLAVEELRRLPEDLERLHDGPSVTVGQYCAVTMLIVEKGFDAPAFHVVATAVLWLAVGLTLLSAADYFYRFFRKADYRAIVPEEERWS